MGVVDSKILVREELTFIKMGLISTGFDDVDNFFLNQYYRKKQSCFKFLVNFTVVDNFLKTHH